MSRFAPHIALALIAALVMGMLAIADRRLSAIEQSISDTSDEGYRVEGAPSSGSRSDSRAVTQNDLERLRSSLSEQIERARSGETDGDPNTTAAATADESLPPPSEARLEADRLLTQAIGNGRWTETERARVRQLASSMEGREYVRFLQSVVHAANTDQIELDGRAPF